MKTALTYEEHCELGEKLKRMQNEFNSAMVSVMNHYGSTGYLPLMQKVERDLSKLRCKLENQLFEDKGKAEVWARGKSFAEPYVPDGAEPLSVYYGTDAAARGLEQK
jgi:hypothetical protein